MVVLTHFAMSGFVFDPKRKYDQRKSFSHPCIKPAGFWLSDESRFGWSEWCKLECHEKLGDHSTEYEVDISQLLVIRSVGDVEALPVVWRDIGNEDVGVGTDWEQIAQRYAGVYMDGNQDIAYESHHIWCRAWDCASACVWRLSCLAPLSPLRRVA